MQDMEKGNHQQWDRCLEIIRQHVTPHVYDVWFRDIICERYDEEKNTVVLAVPSRYVFEYIEEVHLPLLSAALRACFKPGVRLNYRLMDRHTEEPVKVPQIEFSGQYQHRPHITVPDARSRLEEGMRRCIGSRFKWIPAYDKVAEWLTDNKGRGLLCVGTSGLGKSVVCQQVVRQLLSEAFGHPVPSVSALEMNRQIDSLLKERCVIIDDLGKEPVTSYGRTPFYELCDAAERNGILLVITTNLSTTPVSDPRYPSSIEERYGSNVISRLRTVTRAVLFQGDDMRS